MGKPISYDFRVKIVVRRKSGESYKSIAKSFGLSESGVKKVWYAYQKAGDGAYKPNYSNCGRKRIYKADTHRMISEIRDNGQGANYVRSKLLVKYPAVAIPCERTIQRLWKEQGTGRPKGSPTGREKKVEFESSRNVAD